MEDYLKEIKEAEDQMKTLMTKHQQLVGQAGQIQQDILRLQGSLLTLRELKNKAEPKTEENKPQEK